MHFCIEPNFSLIEAENDDDFEGVMQQVCEIIGKHVGEEGETPADDDCDSESEADDLQYDQECRKTTDPTRF